MSFKADDLVVLRALSAVKRAMLSASLPAGERRDYNLCTETGTVVVREYIPFGLGHGRTFNPCPCYVTGNDKRLGHYITLESVDGPIIGVTAVTCPDCGKVFGDYGALRQHARAKHAAAAVPYQGTRRRKRRRKPHIAKPATSMASVLQAIGSDLSDGAFWAMAAEMGVSPEDFV